VQWCASLCVSPLLFPSAALLELYDSPALTCTITTVVGGFPYFF
jgi:hypothetical protein